MCVHINKFIFIFLMFLATYLIVKHQADYATKYNLYNLSNADQVKYSITCPSCTLMNMFILRKITLNFGWYIILIKQEFMNKY
jgi:hypothetical protein